MLIVRILCVGEAVTDSSATLFFKHVEPTFWPSAYMGSSLKIGSLLRSPILYGTLIKQILKGTLT